MRDPPSATSQLEVRGGCAAGQAPIIRARLLPSGPTPQRVALDVTRIDTGGVPAQVEGIRAQDTGSIDLRLPPLDAGAYTARLRVAGGPATRYDFACEAGGDEWADSRPDAKRL